MSAHRSGSRSRLLLGALAGVTSLSSAFALPALRPPPVGADPLADAQVQAAQLATQISAESQRANALSEEYDAARIKVSSLDDQVWTDQLHIAATEQKVAGLKREVRDQAVAAFVEQGSSSKLSAVFDSGQGDLALKEHYLGVAADQSVSAIDRLHATEDALGAEQAKLQVARGQATEALNGIGADQQAVQAETSREQATLGQVKGNIAGLVAEQQQAQAAARQRAFLAEVASEQRRAAPAASAPPRASGPAPSGGGGPSPAPGPPPPAPPPSLAPPSGGGGGAVAVAAAESMEGVPYVWGGASRSGVDCSGLVMLAWDAAGVYLPHYSGAQWADVAHVSAGDLQPGDIIFYGPGGSDHEALYVGGGMEIEALHTGTVVGVYPVGYAGSPSGYGRP